MKEKFRGEVCIRYSITLYQKTKGIKYYKICILEPSKKSPEYYILIKYSSLSFSPASFLKAGTTATVAMLRNGVELVVGSVGDSRATLCRKGRANILTNDHTPDREDERQRYTYF